VNRAVALLRVSWLDYVGLGDFISRLIYLQLQLPKILKVIFRFTLVAKLVELVDNLEDPGYTPEFLINKS